MSINNSKEGLVSSEIFSNDITDALFGLQQEITEIPEQEIEKITERALTKIIINFEKEYGKTVFIPLGVNRATPQKISKSVADALKKHIFLDTNKSTTLIIKDKEVSLVFDAFMQSFYETLNIFAKTTLTVFGLKLNWEKLQEQKNKNPQIFEKWKKNIIIILEILFKELEAYSLKHGKKINIIGTNNKEYNSSLHAIKHLELFQ